MGSRSPEPSSFISNAPYYVPQGTSYETPNLYASADEYDIATHVAPQASIYPHAPNELENSNGQGHGAESNAQLDRLIAAVKSADQQATATQGTNARRFIRSDLQQHGAVPTLSAGRNKRKRTPGDDGDGEQNEGDMSPKRKKSKRASFMAQASDEQNIAENSDMYRPAGVHSAAALFRQPSESTAKKYTRPPMRKLYADLNLSPENFLHLQSAAKAYMLDPDHEERRNCVGNRGKGDTDMVKLRLFNCVKDFLTEGAGERFFGENVAREHSEGTALPEEGGPSQHHWVWPRDGTKIVSLVTPLLRRMVTNERQRQYAIETRKGGTAKKPRSEQGDLDMDAGSHTTGAGAAINSSLTTQFHPAPEQQPPPILHIFICKNGVRLQPRIEIPSRSPDPVHDMPLAFLVQEIRQAIEGIDRGSSDTSTTAAAESTRFTTEAAEAARRNAAAAVALAAAATPDDAKESFDGHEQGREDPDTAAAANSGSVEREDEEVLGEIEYRANGTVFDFRALTARGLVNVRSSDDWEAVKDEVARTVWLEGVVKVVAEIKGEGV
ncbi:hypothetical protein K402DRAFT_395833 [Aulographum hederae CBS 113979]|uniref:Uncharacterized protein n=1 Tax=Aulographum hederae CBS 113979 TaxID=1176131 RepID=A0A6G1GTQ5_9PEZI|nr:hypothetical protein K402DRAFT_395833 [Aulographum hederae CBS 113979]